MLPVTLPSFNPRTRVGCDQFVVHGLDLSATFQSTHPRGVRRYQNRYDEYRWHVSIHAPAWGATSLAQCKAAQRRAFQSTHPRGVRPGHLLVRLRGMQVSIHAPAWGATGYGNGLFFTREVSIHAPAWGATPGLCSVRSLRTSFQSTHPRGVRHFPDTVMVSTVLFQSTHPRGVRPSLRSGAVSNPPVSIHAPAWGAT